MTAAKPAVLEALSAVTLAVSDMTHSVQFYRSLGFQLIYGGGGHPFASFRVGSGYLNLIDTGVVPHGFWGRTIFYVSDVDAFYRQTLAVGLQPEGEPADAPWGERYFHLRDPNGHELSFARPL